LRHLCAVSYRGKNLDDNDGGDSFLTRWPKAVCNYLFSTTDHASVDVPDMLESAESRKDSIAEHYDGNQDLFAAFQGQTRVYTAALFDCEEEPGKPDNDGVLFPDDEKALLMPSESGVSTDTQLDRLNGKLSSDLDRAQQRKIMRILVDLGELKPGQSVLDLGCGYGELVALACRDCGAKSGVGITNSVEMAAEFDRRVKHDNARVEVADFLELPQSMAGKFDLVTSVESIEAIHCQSYRRLAGECRKALRPGGRAVFQIIHAYGSRNPTIRRRTFVPGTTFVQVYIFPGQQLPYLEYVLDAFREEGMVCTHVEQSGLHYARTLRIWRQKLWYENKKRSESKPSWSEEEYRKFVYYLAWCEAGFREGVLDVARCVFMKA
jgi:cyclopropane fatty-acyl-phospholipid synthase-like methyltransferase